MTEQEVKLKHAILWEGKPPDDKVQCSLCSHRCVIAEGETGICGVRENIDGQLYSLNYDKVCAANIDPVEKKPLFHFQPGSKSFSVAAPGCNFQCMFCQNWQISQSPREGHIQGNAHKPQQIVEAAAQRGCKSIAYTYTEPTVFMELCNDCGKMAREHGLANIFVSNGYETPEAIDVAKEWLDGINVDLKSFSEEFYSYFCKAKLAPVLETIRYIKKHSDIWMEITTLIVPGENDCEDELKKIADFIANEVSPDTPWHVSRFYPTYKLDGKSATLVESLQRAYDIGKDAGLHYIYVGNLPGAKAESTYCYNCGEVLIERFGYKILQNNIQGGKCPKCDTEIAGFGL